MQREHKFRAPPTAHCSLKKGIQVENDSTRIPFDTARYKTELRLSIISWHDIHVQGVFGG